MNSLRNHPLYSAWDRNALDLYVKHATFNTTDSTTGQPVVRLKTTALQECLCYMCHRLTAEETFERLQTLDERITLRWILPSKIDVGGSGDTKRRAWVRTKNASNVKIEAGHLVRFLLFKMYHIPILFYM